MRLNRFATRASAAIEVLKYTLAVALLSCCFSACRYHTVLVVELVARKGVVGATKVELTFASTQETPWETAFFAPSGQVFPEGENKQRINIVADGRRGPVTVTARLYDDDERLIGTGEAQVSLKEDRRQDVTLFVEPIEIDVSSKPTDIQQLSTLVGGRQIAAPTAAAAQGPFVATWRSCEAQTCQLWLRAFDENGSPITETDQSDSPEIPLFSETATVDFTDSDAPAVAINEDHSAIVVALHQTPTTSWTLHSHAFSIGQQITRHSDTSTRIDNDETQPISAPDIAAVSTVSATGSAFVVVWAQAEAGKTAIVGQLLDDQGQKLTVDGAMFAVADLAAEAPVSSTSEAPLSLATVAVAPGPADSFIVAWTDQGMVWARIYEGLYPKTAAFSVAEIKTDLAVNVDVTTQTDSYLIVWEDTLDANQSTDNRGTSIRARHFSYDGTPIEAHEYTVNTTTRGPQTAPAVTSRPDGTALVAWTSSEGTDTAVPQIRARMLQANGLPLGDDFVLMQARVARIGKAAIAGVSTQAFVMLADHDVITQVPGLEETEVKQQILGQWLYPSLDHRDGSIGALCDKSDPCNGTLICHTDNEDPDRCIDRCSFVGDYCPNGGRCHADGDQMLCLYRLFE